MAGASMKSIKLRIHSMQNTRQITKAMEMVAASKMNKAQEKALRTRPYYTTLHSTLSGIAAATRDFSSPYLQKREEKRVCCVAIAGDRGLAGGYNSNVLRLLPLPQPEKPAASDKRPADILYEPDCATVFNAMIPEYLGGVIYGALCESLASELSARRMAMDSATQNADEMIDKLNLQYNRARQGSITQELTEIVAGAEE